MVVHQPRGEVLVGSVAAGQTSIEWSVTVFMRRSVPQLGVLNNINLTLPLSLVTVTWTRSGLLQERLVPLGGGGGGGQSPPVCFTYIESIRGGPSLFGPYSSSSTSVLLHFDMEELHDTDLTADISSISPGTM